MEKKFNKKEYDIKYNKEHKTQFKVNLNNDEAEEINHFLKTKNINKTAFIRRAYEIAKIEFGELEKQPRKIKFMYTEFNRLYFQYLDNENEIEVVSKFYFLHNHRLYNSVESLFCNVFNKNVSLINPDDFEKELKKID